MKTWLGLSVFILAAVIFFNSGKSSDDQPVAVVDKGVEVVKSTPPPVVARHKVKVVEEQPPQQEEAAIVEPSPSLPKWTPPTAAEQPDSFVNYRNFQSEDVTKADHPVLVITYGDAPKPNMKFEKRELGNFIPEVSKTLASGEE